MILGSLETIQRCAGYAMLMHDKLREKTVLSNTISALFPTFMRCCTIAQSSDFPYFRSYSSLFGVAGSSLAVRT